MLIPRMLIFEYVQFSILTFLWHMSMSFFFPTYKSIEWHGTFSWLEVTGYVGVVFTISTITMSARATSKH